MAEIAPELAKPLKLNDKGQRTIPFTLAVLRTVKEKVREAGTGRSWIPLRYVFQACEEGPS